MQVFILQTSEYLTLIIGKFRLEILVDVKLRSFGKIKITTV